MYPEWVREIQKDCAEFECPLFFKQWGEWMPLPQGLQWAKYEQRVVHDAVMVKVGKKLAGSELDGRLWHESPAFWGE